MKILLQLFIACSALQAFAMEAANSYVRIRTDCADVRSIKPVGKDFHLLVVNASAQATVEVSAIDPWELVEPISGSCSVTLAAEGAYEVKDAEPDEEGNREPNKDGRIVMFKPMFRVSPDFPSGMSWELLARRRIWSEYQAKRFTAYNAAFKYHCTYGNGNNEEPTHEKHPAYK